MTDRSEFRVVQGLLAELEALAVADSLLARVRCAQGAAPQSSVPEDIPTVQARRILHELQRQVAVVDALRSIYLSAGAHDLPDGMASTPSNVKLWEEVADFFGFDDSE